MDFHRGLAIFECIILRHRVKRQLTFFADGHKAHIQLVSQRRADNKTARIQPRHHIDFLPHIAVYQ